MHTSFLSETASNLNQMLTMTFVAAEWFSFCWHWSTIWAVAPPVGVCSRRSGSKVSSAKTLECILFHNIPILHILACHFLLLQRQWVCNTKENKEIPFLSGSHQLIILVVVFYYYLKLKWFINKIIETEIQYLCI